ncbi:hypothetical protein EDC01DRAFT_634874 [Geopyxis carbonaria]|nr:hypothetical protein EDC01DRAFT_634874 [Geopyxis carbonaria]
MRFKNVHRETTLDAVHRRPSLAPVERDVSQAALSMLSALVYKPDLQAALSARVRKPDLQAALSAAERATRDGHFGVIKSDINWEATCRRLGWTAFYKTMWVYSMTYIHRSIHFPAEWPKDKALKAMKLIAIDAKFKACKVNDLVVNLPKPIRGIRRNKGKQVESINKLDAAFEVLEDSE